MAESQRHILALISSFVNGTPTDIIDHMPIPLDYYSYRELTADLGGEQVSYYSKPGIPDWEIIPPAHYLLIDSAQPTPSDHVWCINCGTGAIASVMAKKVPQGIIQVSTNDILSLSATRLCRNKNNLDNLYVNSETPLTIPLEPDFELILMGISKGRDLNRRWLLHAWLALKPGGRLLVAGANDQGIHSVLQDAADLFHNLTILAYKKGNRVAHFIKSDPAQHTLPSWIQYPGIAPGTWKPFQLRQGDFSWDLVGLPGVFSNATLDAGTQLLLTTLGDLSGKSALDVGCGYGIIGFTAANRGAISVDLVDSQFLAVASCQENISRLRLPGCQVYCSDLLTAVADKSYACIFSNPPFHAGHQVDYQTAQALIASAKAALEPGGFLQLVANRFIRYDRIMTEHFGNATVLAQTPAYHVLFSKKETV